MTATKGTLVRLLVDEFDFSGDTSGIDSTIAMSEEECTTFSAAAAEYEPIMPTMSIEQNGYIAHLGSAGDLEKELQARLGVAGSYVAALWGTDVAACPADVLDGTFGATLKIATPAKGLMTLNGAWGKGAGGHRGTRIFNGSLLTIGAQTAVDLGAAGSDGGECFLFVQAVSGTATDAIIKVQSATTSGGTYADEATFTIDDVGGYKQVMSGAVNRWLRVNLTDLGGADGLTFVMIVCVKGITE